MVAYEEQPATVVRSCVLTEAKMGPWPRPLKAAPGSSAAPTRAGHDAEASWPYLDGAPASQPASRASTAAAAVDPDARAWATT